MNRRKAIRHLIGTGALGLLAPAACPAESAVLTPAAKPLTWDQLQFWLESSLRRVYPTSPPGDAGPLALLTARNARLSFQACFRNGKTNSVIVRCEVLDAGDCQPVVRRVGFVPLRAFNTYTPADELEGIGHVPGLCPDPLFPETSAHIGPQANGAFWISLRVPADAKPGVREVKIRFTLENEFAYVDWTRPKPWSVELIARVDVRPLVL